MTYIIIVMSLNLLETVYFVRVAYTLPGVVSTYSTPMMFSGMVRTVYPTAHAVSSTTLHGLATKNLTSATTDDIELRICTTFLPGEDDVPLELIELYVQ